MTLHSHLLENGLRLDKHTESRIGEIISNEYRDRFFVSAPKVLSEEIGGLVNDYTEVFLASCSYLIIKFLNPKHA